MRLQQLVDPTHLIDDLRDIRRAESLGLSAERYIQFALPIESHQSVEARTIEKQEV
jgi:hypothetical protein